MIRRTIMDRTGALRMAPRPAPVPIRPPEPPTCIAEGATIALTLVMIFTLLWGRLKCPT